MSAASHPSAESSTCAELQARLVALLGRGVQMIDPRQVYVAADVDLERIAAGVVLYPGVSLYGKNTLLSDGVELGREGPVVIRDSLLGPKARVASGYVEGAILLDGASLGANAHVRSGTLLEEEASTAHAVGLKQTILLPYVTLGPLINFCDCLMAGGRSRRDHSEVGSGYIHFSFTPWGERGDKATPSLFGDVVNGVFCRNDRIFLGGLGGSVGPLRVGYGALAAAGQVLRRNLPEHTLRLQPAPTLERPFHPGEVDEGRQRLLNNLAFIGQIAALQGWYAKVRLARARLHGDRTHETLSENAIKLLSEAIDERWRQVERLSNERGWSCQRPRPVVAQDKPVSHAVLARPGTHLAWLAALPSAAIATAQAWLVERAQAWELSSTSF